MAETTPFPKGFLWGCATSSYQVEGSPLADGAGSNVWHRFAHTPGRTVDGDHGDIAADHYRRWGDDVALMADLGMNAYRFSIAWARVMPEGRGPLNPKGIDFYDRLVDALLARGIAPMATLYHWDLPSALDDRGGWLNPDIAPWFAEYAAAMYRRLDDRVTLWATLNEPWVVADGGYLHGVLAPGHRNRYEAPIASHYLLKAHALAVRAYRSIGRHEVGLVVNIEPKYAASPAAEDLAARDRAEAYMNRQYLDPVFLGRYPELLEEMFGDAWPRWPDADFDLLREPFDFLGVNYYTRSVTRHDAGGYPCSAVPVRQPQATHTETGWEVYPPGLADTLAWVRDRYGPIPLYVTENGAAFYDPPAATGEIDDALRVDYLRTHIAAVGDAIRRGCDVRGYFAWSLLDNFEWAHGYTKRFGLVHVDYATQRRTPKRSARWYSALIAANGADPGRRR